MSISRLCLVVASVLVFVGATATAARPVARWDVVPDQCVSKTFSAGVCAFHIDGVKVEFRIAGKLVHIADAPTLNPRTGVWEFVYDFDPAGYSDGPVEIQARAISLSAAPESYDLPSISLYANATGSLAVDKIIYADASKGDDANPGSQDSPVKSLAKAVQLAPAGGTIYLQVGSYDSDNLRGGSNRDYWTTITPAPGVSREQVEITPGRPGTQRLKWTNVTICADAEGKYLPLLSGEQGKHKVWLDNVAMLNKRGRWAAGTQAFGNRYLAYITGGTSTDIANGPGASLIRDHHMKSITSDAWTGGGKLVVNCSVTDINPGRTGAHPDFHQSYSRAPDWTEDVILYNVRGYDCISQGLFGSRLRNAAFVNVLFDRGDTVMYSQYSGPMENVLFLHMSIIHQSWLWRGQGADAYSPTDVHMVDCIIPSMGVAHDAKTDGLTIDSCHFINAKSKMGSNTTTGDPAYLDDPNNDFRIAPNSPAAANGKPLQCVPADINGNAYDPKMPNRGCYAKTAANPPSTAGTAGTTGTASSTSMDVVRVLPITPTSKSVNLRPSPSQVLLQATDGKQAVCILAPEV